MPLLHAHFLPSFIPPDALRGAAAVVIDLLRASTTIVRALDVGAARVVPCLEPDHAIAARTRLIAEGVPATHIVLGGERGGVRIPGFDLGNSPAEYTHNRLDGRTLIFTTTNGTRALFAARDHGASTVLVGCLNNLTAIVDRLVTGARPVHLIAAGTSGEVSQEDVLCIGAFAAALAEHGFFFGEDDQVRIAADLWRAAAARAAGSGSTIDILNHSRGGRNLHRIGLETDIADSVRLDCSTAVPALDNAGNLVPEPPR